MESTEKDLIERARKGDERAFEKLVRKYETKIFNLLLRMTGDRAEASDLFQEAFIHAWQKIGAFRGDAQFSTWLYRIAVNEVLMKRRKRKLKTVSMDAPVETADEPMQREFGDWSDNPLATLENQELRERLEAAVNRLPEKYKAVLVLSDFQGLPNDQIGKVLKLSLPSVKTRLHRARLALRQSLQGYFKPS